MIDIDQFDEREVDLARLASDCTYWARFFKDIAEGTNELYQEDECRSVFPDLVRNVSTGRASAEDDIRQMRALLDEAAETEERLNAADIHSLESCIRHLEDDIREFDQVGAILAKLKQSNHWITRRLTGRERRARGW